MKNKIWIPAILCLSLVAPSVASAANPPPAYKQITPTMMYLKKSGIIYAQTASQPAAKPVSAYGQQIYANMLTVYEPFLGAPYLYAGVTPKGFDCSGFIQYVHKLAGHPLVRKSSKDYFASSSYVSNPVPGDLIFFKDTYGEGISHMGIYLGNGQFVHASTSRGVEVAKVTTSYWVEHFAGYGRLKELSE